MNENIRLPKTAIPNRYEINLDINLDGEDANIGDLIKLKNIFMRR